MSDKTEIYQNDIQTSHISAYWLLSPVLLNPTKKTHKLGIMKNRLISTQKDANASIVVIVMTTKHSDGDKY